MAPLADRSANLQADLRVAEGELTAIRREIDEVIAADACRDEQTAASYHARLEAAKGRVRSLRAALADVDRAG